MIWTLLASLSFAGEPGVHDALWRQLLARDGFVGCDAVWALGEAPVVRAELIAATKASQPPWAPMRAAACVAERAGTDDVALAEVSRWMADPAVPGLALVAVDALDGWTEARALPIAKLASARLPTDRVFARYAPRSLAASHHPAVRALSPLQP
jgi:hypothetical protein